VCENLGVPDKIGGGFFGVLPKGRVINGTPDFIGGLQIFSIFII